MTARQLLILSLIISVLAAARVSEAVSAFVFNPGDGVLWSRAGVALMMCLGAGVSWYAWTRHRNRVSGAAS